MHTLPSQSPSPTCLAVEAGVDPLFMAAAEEEAAGLIDEAFERWLQGILVDPSEGPRRILIMTFGNSSNV